jgi:hypothetical protein
MPPRRVFALHVSVTRFVRLRRSDRRLTLEALRTLISVRTRLLSTSWQEFSRELGEPRPGEAEWQWDGDRRTLIAVVRAVERWRKVGPNQWTCLVRALSGQRMLARRGIPSTLVLGLRQDDDAGEFTAHGWLRVGEHIVIGGQESLGYRPVAQYPSHNAALRRRILGSSALPPSE